MKNVSSEWSFNYYIDLKLLCGVSLPCIRLALIIVKHLHINYIILSYCSNLLLERNVYVLTLPIWKYWATPCGVERLLPLFFIAWFGDIPAIMCTYILLAAILLPGFTCNALNTIQLPWLSLWIKIIITVVGSSV